MDYFFIVAAALSALGAIMAVTQVRSIESRARIKPVLQSDPQ